MSELSTLCRPLSPTLVCTVPSITTPVVVGKRLNQFPPIEPSRGDVSAVNTSIYMQQVGRADRSMACIRLCREKPPAVTRMK